MGHLYLGEAFSRSAYADVLRRNMCAQSMDEVTQVGRMWPQTEQVQTSLDLIAKAECHTVAIMDGDMPLLLVSLFGEIGATIPLAPAPAYGKLTFSDKGNAWRVALPSRELTTFTILGLVEERMKILRVGAAEDEPEPRFRE